MNCIDIRCIHCKAREKSITPIHLSNGSVLDSIIEPYCELGHQVRDVFSDKGEFFTCADKEAHNENSN